MSATGSKLRVLECRVCCTEVDPDRPVGVCPTCGLALLATYDLRALDGPRWRASLSERGANLWRYRELLPVRDDRNVVTLGEGFSPIHELESVAEAPGVRLLVKDDGGLPTGSFKSRGMAVAVSRAIELGLRELFVPSAGNAGVALAAYGARGHRAVRVYLPERTPPPMVAACRVYGAEVVQRPGTLREVGEAARAAERSRGAFDMSTLREPYRVEGKKTMGFEIWEQLGPGRLPDAVVYPAGGGTGLVGMHKAFAELRGLGLLEKEPRLIAVQPEGCAPLVRALRENAPRAAPWPNPWTLAPGLLVPAPFSSERILEAVRDSGGGGVSVSDRELVEAMRRLGREHGVSVSPEAAAPFAALPQLFRNGQIRSGETVLLYATGTGLAFSVEALEASLGGPAPSPPPA